MSEKFCCLDGEFVKEKEAKISIADQGFLYGRGIFTTIRVENGKCELLESHLERLFFQSKLLDCYHSLMLLPVINQLIQLNGMEQGVFRLKIIFSPLHYLLTIDLYEFINEPIRLTFYPHRIVSPQSHLKSLSYLDHLLVKEYAKKRGFEDAITVNEEKKILETGTMNLFWIDQSICYLPSPSLPHLRGVFLENLLKNIPLEVKEVFHSIVEIPESASFYCTNSLMHFRPVLSIDERNIPAKIEYETILLETLKKVLKT